MKPSGLIDGSSGLVRGSSGLINGSSTAHSVAVSAFTFALLGWLTDIEDASAPRLLPLARLTVITFYDVLPLTTFYDVLVILIY